MENDEKNKGIKDDETPDARFKRLATLRVNNVLQKLDVLGNCANRSYYEYTEEEIDKIFNTIDKKIRDTKSLFRPTEKTQKFKL